MTEDEQKAVKMISDACKLLGWQIAMQTPNPDKPDEQVDGLVIGTDEYINNILKTTYE